MTNAYFCKLCGEFVEECDIYDHLFEYHNASEDEVTKENCVQFYELGVEHRTSSWLHGLCKECGYPVVATQPTEPYQDIWWYCSHKGCPHHDPGEQTGDQEEPTWIRYYRFSR